MRTKSRALLKPVIKRFQSLQCIEQLQTGFPSFLPVVFGAPPERRGPECAAGSIQGTAPLHYTIDHKAQEAGRTFRVCKGGTSQNPVELSSHSFRIHDQTHYDVLEPLPSCGACGVSPRPAREARDPFGPYLDLTPQADGDRWGTVSSVDSAI